MIPTGTQRCINIEIWLNIGHDVLQRRNVDRYSMLMLRCCINVEI